MVPAVSTRDRGPAGASQLATAGRFRVALDSRVADLTTPLVPAFRAIDPGATDRPLVALLAGAAAPPRAEAIEALRGAKHPNLMQIVAAEPLDRSVGDEARYAIIVERPMGGPFLRLDRGRFSPLGEHELIDRVLRPVLTGLAAVHERGIAHRALRPDNLFYTDPEHRVLAIGDAASAPPGSQQPESFEPIERALAHPFGRGSGTRACDSFALGALLLTLLFGELPEEGPDVLAARLDQGSFAALVGKRKVPPALRDLLRGLLADDPGERWTTADVLAWIDSGRTNPRRGGPTRRVVMPYQFGGRPCGSRAALAFAMASDRRAAAAELQTTRISAWLLNSIGDADAAKRFAAIVTGARGDNAKGRDMLVTRACAVLDPAGPLRLDGVAVMADGLGPLLAHAVASDERPLVTTLSRAISQGLPVDWAELNGGSRGPFLALQREFQRLQAVVRSRNLGQGIERCLYELNQLAPCASAQLEGQFAVDPPAILAGIERGAATAVGDPIDRHLAGMLGARMGSNEERLLVEAASADKVERGLATLQVLARVQEKMDQSLPQLARRMNLWLTATCRALRSKSLREDVEGRLRKAADSGSLVAMANALCQPGLWRRDRDGHRAARDAWRRDQVEIAALNAGADARLRHAHALGQRLAAGTAWAGLLVVVTTVLVG